ncbi:cyclin PHO80-like protein, partial [Mycotypha africana]|uniref:cyclin PHO80-like protein n=1 Tax=Mycotypha africana TaxID=64632 RepID=UPI0023016E3F
MGPTASTGTTSTTTTTTATTTTTTTNLTATTTSILTTFTATLNNKNDFCNKYDEDRPCEKYKQFLDSSRQERTFMIEKLVEIFANVIDSIWHPKFLLDQQKAKVIPTRGFCNEILKRSNTTYATLQISLFYVFRIKKVVHEKLFRRYQAAQNPQQMKLPRQTHLDDLMCCGRRMFLASLMVASKYLHDKNYHNKAWSKITGLDIKEINAAEMAFLKLIDYRLHVSKPTFDKWYTQLHGHIQR